MPSIWVSGGGGGEVRKRHALSRAQQFNSREDRACGTELLFPWRQDNSSAPGYLELHHCLDLRSGEAIYYLHGLPAFLNIVRLRQRRIAWNPKPRPACPYRSPDGPIRKRRTSSSHGLLPSRRGEYLV